MYKNTEGYPDPTAAVEFLRNRGYDAVLKNGTVTVHTDKREKFARKKLEALKKILQKAGYQVELLVTCRTGKQIM